MKWSHSYTGLFTQTKQRPLHWFYLPWVYELSPVKSKTIKTETIYNQDYLHQVHELSPCVLWHLPYDWADGWFCWCFFNGKYGYTTMKSWCYSME